MAEHARLGHRRRHGEGRARQRGHGEDRHHDPVAQARVDPAPAGGHGAVGRAVQHDAEHGVDGARRHLVGLRQDLAGRVVHQDVERPLLPDPCPSWPRPRRARARRSRRSRSRPWSPWRVPRRSASARPRAGRRSPRWRRARDSDAPSSGRVPVPPPVTRMRLPLSRSGWNISSLLFPDLGQRDAGGHELVDLGRRVAVLGQHRPGIGAEFLGLAARGWAACARASPDCRRCGSRPSPTPCRGAWCADAP